MEVGEEAPDMVRRATDGAAEHTADRGRRPERRHAEVGEMTPLKLSRAFVRRLCRRIDTKTRVASQPRQSPFGECASCSRSKIRLRGNRDQISGCVLNILGADLFPKLLLHAAERLHRRPRRVEGLRVLDAEPHLQGLAAVGQAPALGDVQLFRMRRAVIIHEGLAVLPDGIDDQRVALVMARHTRMASGWPNAARRDRHAGPAGRPQRSSPPPWASG